jgi:glycerophosphoryl diester phosphodiesterase
LWTVTASWSARRADGVPLIIAHRGASALEPENSLAAFRRAAADGADGVELDVLCCATGEVVVFHDDDLTRLGARPERIDALSLAALQAVQLTSGASIPTLEEVLDACGPRLLVNVELKAAELGDVALGTLVNRVAALLDAAGASERALVSSFDPRAVALWRQRAPSVRSALLFERDGSLPFRRAWTLARLRPFAVHPQQVLCGPRAVRRWHRRGFRVHVWTVDDPGTLRQCRDVGVDGIITNDPARARKVLAEIRRP